MLRPDGTHANTLGKEGTAPGEFRCPKGVAVDPMNGNILVADCHNHRVQVLSSDGSHLRTIGSQGSGPGQFKHPHGVAVDGGGNVLVADYMNHRVQVSLCVLTELL